MEDPQKVKAVYAVPCLSLSGDIFFTTFNTRNENEAKFLASCIQGKKGKRALVLITEDGDIYHI
jgi:hypothetical protein